MKVSLNTVKQLIDFELPAVDELKKRIDGQLGKVEAVIDLRSRYDQAVIVRVVECGKHPSADRLSVCTVDDGGVAKGVPRNEQGYVQVVCGAPNVHANMFAIWLPPGSTVPASYEDDEPFILSARELRGVTSYGMLAAEDELGIGTDHTGIIELTTEDLPPSGSVAQYEPGQNFAQVFGLDDTVFDIENKMFTHRPDCFGQLGVAREVAGILGHKFSSPDWYLNIPEFNSASGLELTVTNEATEKVPRFMAVAIHNVSIKPSPFWLQCELVRLGSKPINNIVDITNLVMLQTAQPLHAYDYDKLAGQTLGARMANAGETLTLLNGKNYELTADDIVITDGEKPIGLGGVMGGGNSEVSGDTKNIVLECATFDMYAIRKTSMRHGLFTDAVTRFNKGQSPLQNAAVLARAMEYVKQLAGGEQASVMYDKGMELPQATEVNVSVDFINLRLGSSLAKADVIKLLENVEIATEDVFEHDAPLEVIAPFWRTDIELPEDVVEEVGRLYGFDKLPKELPVRSLAPVAKNQKRLVAHKIRNNLAKLGANEVLTYSFVHQNVLQKAGQNTKAAYQLSNALSPDLQYYRISLTPSILDKIHGNVKAGYDEFILFEIGKGHSMDKYDQDGLPVETEFVDAVYTSKNSKQGAPYFHVRRLATELAKGLGFTLKLSPLTAEEDFPVTAPFDLTRSALVSSRAGEYLGIIGEFDQSAIKNFKLPEYSAGMSLDLNGLVKAHIAAGATYSPLSRYPALSQDISLRVKNTLTYEEVFWTVWSAVQNNTDETYEFRLKPLSIYQSDDVEYKTVTFRLEVVNFERTLTDADVSPLLDAAADAAKTGFGAERI